MYVCVWGGGGREGRRVAQSIERRTLEVEVRGSKSVLGTWWGRISTNQPYQKGQDLHHQDVGLDNEDFFGRSQNSPSTKLAGFHSFAQELEKMKDATVPKKKTKKNNQENNRL